MSPAAYEECELLPVPDQTLYICTMHNVWVQCTIRYALDNFSAHPLMLILSEMREPLRDINTSIPMRARCTAAVCEAAPEINR